MATNQGLESIDMPERSDAWLAGRLADLAMRADVQINTADAEPRSLAATAHRRAGAVMMLSYLLNSEGGQDLGPIPGGPLPKDLIEEFSRRFEVAIAEGIS